MFRLPSEKAFLLGGFDYNDIFGKRRGTTHSPHIRTQMDLDTNICLLMIFVSTFLLFAEAKRTNTLVTLRENLVNSDKGRFKLEDFN